MMLRAVIADDEPLARQTLRDFAVDVEQLAIVGEAAHGREAVRLIDQLRPELVFLDVQMPELSGLQVLEQIDHKPAVIFTTAYDNYAIPAFELQALDYLLKPFGRERFRAAVARATTQLAQREQAVDVRDRARAAIAGPTVLDRIFVYRNRQIVPLRLEEIVRVQAAGDYSEVHGAGGRYLVCTTLGSLEARLDPQRFLRVHRSHIINVQQIASMQQYDARRLALFMADGSTIVASRTGTQLLRRLVP